MQNGVLSSDGAQRRINPKKSKQKQTIPITIKAMSVKAKVLRNKKKYQRDESSNGLPFCGDEIPINIRATGRANIATAPTVGLVNKVIKIADVVINATIVCKLNCISTRPVFELVCAFSRSRIIAHNCVFCPKKVGFAIKKATIQNKNGLLIFCLK